MIQLSNFLDFSLQLKVTGPPEKLYVEIALCMSDTDAHRHSREALVGADNFIPFSVFA